MNRINRINISGVELNTDPSFRYKMDDINVIEERGKTVINNTKKICEDLNRSEKLLVSYFKKHFSVQFILKNGKIMTTKSITKKNMKDALKVFIEYLVLCPKCKLPETLIKPIDGNYVMKCECCNFMGELDKPNIKTKMMRDFLMNMKAEKGKKLKK